MKKETREFIRVQAGLQCLVEQALKVAYQKPTKPSMTLRDIYLSQFINISNNQLWRNVMKCGKGKKRK